MLTDKNILSTVSLQRRAYERHRSRVKNATSTVDVQPPPGRPHVIFDAKRNQLESGRQAEILRENFILLKKLHNIMHRREVNDLSRQKSGCVRTR
ncbi:uncharacterized protein LOC107266360 [Cephus cinctus]|uniref:Uncharacterized protein LOC107266360 n=1 Tax=Cephus cinctus TaxID=211228 RepID=A0AAJ7FHL5_CEPCN|nr:uncharacterized protein LOC107266360 [Cephus cinctus]